MSNEVEIVVTGRDTGADAALQNTRRSMNEVGDTTDDLATKAGTATGAFGALASGLELMGMEGSAAAGIMASAALATDAFSGVTDFATLALQSSIVMKAKDAVATAASTAANVAASAATKAMAAAQWVLNAALSANPIGLVIIAVVALVAAIVIAYKKSETFRAIVQAAFRAVTASGRLMWEGLKVVFGGISTAAQALWTGLKRVFSGGVAAIKGYARLVSAPYRAAFSAIRSAWNSTVGGKGFSVPGWIPGVGGKSFRIPYFASGGVSSGGLAIVGERGRELVNLPSGSSVSPNSNTERALGAAAGGGRPIVVSLELDGKVLARVLVDPLRREVKRLGGNAQAVLGAV